MQRLAFLFLLLLTACRSPEAKESLRLNLFTEPPTLDSRKATDTTSMNVLIALFEGLTRLDRDEKPQLALADDLMISDEGKTYTFHLKESYWSNGEPLTSADFVHAWRSTLAPSFPSPFAYELFVFKNGMEIKEGTLPPSALGVEAPDPQTLIIHLTHPLPYFLELLATPIFFPLPAKQLTQEALWATDSAHIVGNGPFQLAVWEHESRLILKKNPLYWDAQSVQLEQIDFAVIPDVATEFYMFESGELDWAGAPLSTLPVEYISPLREKGVLNCYDSQGVYYYKINTKRPPLNNVKIRKALALAIDRQAITTHILQAGQSTATALVPPKLGTPPARYFADADPCAAKRLFAQGMREEGLERFPPLTLSYNAHTLHQKVAEAIQQQWHRALGIHIQLESCDWKVYLPKMQAQNYDIARMGWIGVHSDPISYLLPFKTRDSEHLGGHNETGWEDPTYRALLDEAQWERDQEKRKQLLRSAEEIILDQMPIIPLYFHNFVYLKKPHVEGVILTRIGTIDFKEAYLTR